MDTILEKALNLIANAQTLEKLQEVARWAETHAELTQEERDHVHEAIKSRIVEVSVKSM